MANIEIDGQPYKVVESMGFVHSIGLYAKVVDDAGTERMVVKRGKEWMFWTAHDRTEPLRKAIKGGWKPGNGPTVRGQ